MIFDGSALTVRPPAPQARVPLPFGPGKPCGRSLVPELGVKRRRQCRILTVHCPMKHTGHFARFYQMFSMTQTSSPSSKFLKCRYPEDTIHRAILTKLPSIEKQTLQSALMLARCKICINLHYAHRKLKKARNFFDSRCFPLWRHC